MKIVAQKGALDNLVSPSFSGIKELLKQYLDAGGKIVICPSYAKTHNVTDESLIENTSLMGATAVQEEALGRHIMFF